MTDRRTFLKSLGLAAATAATAPLASGVAAKASAPARGKRPNIILIVSDEHQANTCGCYGSQARTVSGGSPTPHIDALAAEGVRFDSMYCASPLCAPSRAAYMTGVYPHTTTALHHKMQRREPGLTRFPGVKESLPGMGHFFREAGYATAAMGKMHVHGEHVDGWDMGFDVRELRFYTRFPGKHYADLQEGDVNRRYREMPPYIQKTYREIDPKRFAHAPEGLTVKQNGVNEHHLETLVEDEDDMFDPLVTDRSLAFIEEQTRAQHPFFIHVGLEKPHRPWTIHQRYLDRFNPDDMPLPATTAEWVEKGMFPFCQSWCHSGHQGDSARRSTAAYYACAAQVDDCVGRIVERCRELGILEETVIVYTSDHGENLYEHGLIEKHNMLDPAARVPFIIRAPWTLPQGAVTHAPASLIDMLPTCCELAGAEASADFEGASLLAAVSGKADPDRLVFSEFYQNGSVTRGDEFLPVRMGLNRTHKYIYTQGAADQLYDRLTGGEATLTNLAFDPANEALVSRLRLCTLDNWELDEYPQLDASVEVDEDAVSLSWESAGPGARYDVYRSEGGDPYTAQRLAAGIEALAYTDATAQSGATYTYWVLGHDAVTEPFADSRGKRRYGDQPIVAPHYARTLPITPRLKVAVVPGGSRAFRYTPQLGLAFGGLSWIHIGMPPVVRHGGTALQGPVTILSPRAVGTEGHFAAELRTSRPGYKPDHTLKLLLAYQNMHHHYLVGLDREGTLGIWRQDGEWKQEILAARKLSQVDSKDWHRFEVAFKDGHFTVFLDGEERLAYTDPDPLTEGRFGFEAPHHLGAAEIRAVAWKDRTGA
jgi:arylsulfatase A-like enzyme